ncbi:MAG: HAMP domain-containing histidine kinase [Ruminococcus sp.]|nr:HAMP domain-containing histidine kinase [Ruminococcus sp.]
MFKKVQLKFFSIIVSILLAIFIAVLGSINLIMNSLMERQSKNVLEKIAEGVEYDENTSTFTFKRDLDRMNDKFDNNSPPPEKPSGEPVPVTTAAATEITTDTSTTTAQTSAETEPITETTEQTAETDEEITEPEQEEQDNSEDEPPPPPEENNEEPPQEQPPAAFTPSENNDNKKDDDDDDDDEDDNDDEDDDDDDDDKPPFPDDDFNPFDPDRPNDRPDDWGNRWDNGERDNHGGKWGYVFMSAYCAYIPNGAYLLADTSTAEIQTAPFQDFQNNQPPEYDFKKFNREPVPKSLDTIDFFIIMSDKNGKYLDIHNNDDLSQENAQKYIDAISEKGITGGMLNNYQFLSAEKSNGTIFVFTDKTSEMDMLGKLKRTTVLIGIISIVLLSAASYFLSGLIVKPIKDAFDKQKQFISDASHELKTPLTVISTNADVLSGEIGDNKWLNYIQDQADRMNVLVNELLNLTRLENNTSSFILTEFDLSKAVENTALPFECQAFETNKNFVLNIEEGIHITASEQHIKQMAAIFIDNALKYSKDGGTVRVSLTKDKDRKILFSVYNTGSGVKEEEKDKIFERFYRSDESRNRAAGSYGLGLAIAKSIIDKHKFKIHIDNEEGRSICFIVTMQS